MKSLFVTLMLAGAMSFTAQAQESRPQGGRNHHEKMTAEQRAEKQTDKMTQALHLTDDQRKSVYQANLKAAREMEPVRQQMKEARLKAKAIHQEKEVTLKQSLTDQQFQELKKFRMEQRKLRKERMAGFRHMKEDAIQQGRPAIDRDVPKQ